MQLAIMGYGVVGSGVAEVLIKNHDSIVRRSGQDSVQLKYILDLKDFPDDPLHDRVIKDFNLILNDDEISIVVETMGGLHPAYDFVKSLLERGKSVVTSNKELVASKGAELLRIAREHNVNFLFEASVGGGIPIIRPISQCLAANMIEEVAGILNGTTNFILTKMIDDHMDFETALRLAQQNGYAESDPTADIEGIDSCRKICILASLCFGYHVYPDSVYTEGISRITLEDVTFAHKFGKVIKLLGIAKKLGDGRVTASVRPCLVDHAGQFANVTDVFNSILVRGDVIGDVCFYGRGAGKLPTASAVVADVIDCAKHSHRPKLFGWQDAKENYVTDHLDDETALYVRATGDEKAVLDVFPAAEITSANGTFAFITDVATERQLLNRLAQIPGIEVLSTLRVTDY
ncbi:MAG: homoserine dehydrogenase [Clostridia bacterium]